MRKEEVKYDCSHFQGHIPCKPNKLHDVQCDNCSHYEYDADAIIHLDSKQSCLDAIYKICEFTKETEFVDNNWKDVISEEKKKKARSADKDLSSWTGLGKSGHDRSQSFDPISHVPGPKLNC